jgi:osmotically-inducible protein OsmY/sporulation protein YlmC with PRC-barrel domain
MAFEFKPGAPVYSRDGEFGKLKYLTLDPEDRTVTGLIVNHGNMLPKSVVVPVCWVEKADDKQIVLNASTEELENLPEYREVEFRLPDSSVINLESAGHVANPAASRVWIGPYPSVMEPERPTVVQRARLGVDQDEILLRRGMPVYAHDGYRVGTLDHVLVDKDAHQIRHLVVEHGMWLQGGDNIILPANAVESITEDGIRLHFSREELDRLTHYKPPMDDMQLKQVISRGLETQPETKGHNLKVSVQRGLVRLFGKVTGAIALAAYSLIRKIRGVIGFEDRTTRPREGHAADTDATFMQPQDRAVALRINETLERLPGDELQDVSVNVNQGVATLSGTTRTILGKALVERAAGRVEGVKSVINHLDSDTAIRARVEAALAENRHTSLVPIEVLSQGGVVTLYGKVPSFQVKETAEQVARSVPGVKAVINELEARPEEAEEEKTRVQPIYYQLPYSG